MMKDIKDMPEGSIILLHACKLLIIWGGNTEGEGGIIFHYFVVNFSHPFLSLIWLPGAHNPTGMDPTLVQWKEMSETIRKHKLVPFFDCAYQGVSFV